MKEITIDCRGVLSREETHRALAQALSFPDHYGRNLDALHDQLTAIRQDTTLVLENFRRDAPENRGFLRVFSDSMEENPHLTVLFE